MTYLYIHIYSLLLLSLLFCMFIASHNFNMLDIFFIISEAVLSKDSEI